MPTPMIDFCSGSSVFPPLVRDCIAYLIISFLIDNPNSTKIPKYHDIIQQSFFSCIIRSTANTLHFIKLNGHGLSKLGRPYDAPNNCSDTAGARLHRVPCLNLNKLSYPDSTIILEYYNIIQ